MIKGLQPTSLINYPGTICATIFLGGCNMRCGYCYNKELATRPHTMHSQNEIDVLKFLKKRRHLLEGVCVTGGEPTIHAQLPNLLKKIKNLGYKIKLDTNGTNPEMVHQLILHELVDYIAMDVKASEENYNKITRTETNMENIRRTIDIIKLSLIDYEFRTTVIPSLTTEKEIGKIANWLEGAKCLYLQEFKPTDTLQDKSILQGKFHSKEDLQKYKNIAKKSIPFVGVRWA